MLDFDGLMQLSTKRSAKGRRMRWPPSLDLREGFGRRSTLPAGTVERIEGEHGAGAKLKHIADMLNDCVLTGGASRWYASTVSAVLAAAQRRPLFDPSDALLSAFLRVLDIDGAQADGVVVPLRGNGRVH